MNGTFTSSLMEGWRPWWWNIFFFFFSFFFPLDLDILTGNSAVFFLLEDGKEMGNGDLLSLYGRGGDKGGGEHSMN